MVVERENGVGFLGVAPIHPALSSVAFKDFGDSVLKLMSNLDHVGIMLAIHADGFLPEDKGGSVNLHKDGRIGISYPVGEKLKEAFKEAHDVLTQVTLKAGAQKAMTFHFDPIVMRSDSERSKLQKAKYGALEHAIFSAHQMGGCAMGRPKNVGGGSDFRYRELDNLFVADGSLFLRL